MVLVCVTTAAVVSVSGPFSCIVAKSSFRKHTCSRDGGGGGGDGGACGCSMGSEAVTSSWHLQTLMEQGEVEVVLQ